MEDTKTFSMTTGKEVAQAPPLTSVALIKNVMEVAIKNRELIDIKKGAASNVIKAVRAKIKTIETDAQDKYFNDLIVISSNTVQEMERLRKEYTGKVNAWLKEEIAPENELKVEIGELVNMRNVRARRLKEAADKRAEEIQKKKDRELYVIQVKKEMQIQVETGLVDKIIALEKSIEEYFIKNLTALNGAKMKQALEGMRPGLKEDFFLSLLQVDFDSNLMSQSEFDDLVKRAKTYWIFEDINKRYQENAAEVIKKWVDKIPARVKEIEIIAKGGDQGERVKKIVEEREKTEAAEFKKEVLTKLAETTTAINDNAQGEQMSAEFTAQAQTQDIEQPTGTRSKAYLVIDKPGDTLALSKIIGSIIIHMIPHKSAQEKIEMVLQHGADGKPKVDKDGDPVYTPGVQFWLDTALTLGYKPNIEGISLKYKTSTVAKKK